MRRIVRTLMGLMQTNGPRPNIGPNTTGDRDIYTNLLTDAHLSDRRTSISRICFLTSCLVKGLVWYPQWQQQPLEDWFSFRCVESRGMLSGWAALRAWRQDSWSIPHAYVRVTGACERTKAGGPNTVYPSHGGTHAKTSEGTFDAVEGGWESHKVCFVLFFFFNTK